MDIIMICVFGGLTALLLLQIRNIIVCCRSSAKGNFDDSEGEQCSSSILEHSEKVMCAVVSGKIKKQLIENDALIYDNYNVMCQFANFIDNSVTYKKIQSLKGSRYDG